MIERIRLILGCGYLGRRVARRWVAQGHRVVGLVRGQEQGRELAALGIEPLVADVTQPDSLDPLPQADTVLWCVGYDPQCGKSRREVYVDGLGSVLDRLGPHTRRIIHISSTGVYGEAGGEWVDEDSPCRPTREAGQALLAAERLLAEHPLGPRAIVLRLAGLYGPGRLPRTAELRAGRPIAVPAGCHVNLIHVDDAVAAVLAVAEHPQPPRYCIVADGHPVDRRDYLTRLAEVLGLPAPVFCDVDEAAAARPTSRGTGDKRVRNDRLLRELGVRLTYPSYREGLAAAK